MTARTHSVHCFTPPHMLKEIARRGTPTQRERALRTLVISEQFRGQRVVLGEVADLLARAEAPAKRRLVYDAQHGSALPGKLVRSEGEPVVSDVGVNEAYDGAGATYDLYYDAYQRNSIDDKGMTLESTVHYQQSYDNAFWNGAQMVYGDGDADLPEAERLFNRFTIAVDVMGHELTHGVTENTSQLVYSDQPGALNESISDVFGSLVKQRMLSQTADNADWIIGEGLFTANVNGVGIRSMKAPGTAYDDPVLGKDPQPAHMRDFQHTNTDNGGVHINSGIPNHAFYLMAVEIGGYSWEKAGRIWYVALRDRFGPRTDFQGAATLTYQVAGELFGTDSLEQQAVKKGWAGVGLSVEGSVPTPENKGCLAAPTALLMTLILPLTRSW